MAFWTSNKSNLESVAVLTNQISELEAKVEANDLTATIRGPLNNRGGGQYDASDNNHNVYLDLGYPAIVDFFMLYHMYSRFGVAKKAIEWPVETGFKTAPTIDASESFLSEFKKVVKKTKFWQRMKALDTRQRVGQYAGLYIRVRDGLTSDQPLAAALNGSGAIVGMTPLYQSQLTPTSYETDQNSDRFSLPVMYQLNTGDIGGRNKGSEASISIHWTRIVIAAEGSDNGGIFGVPVLEAGYNDLVDLRKINGGMAEGIYKNAAMKVVFNISDTTNSSLKTTILATLKDQFDSFIWTPFRRAFVAAGMDVNLLQTTLTDPKNANTNSMNDFAASVGISSSILLGNQTGKLAGDQDEVASLSVVQSRRENWMTEMIESVIDWMIFNGVLPKEEYELEWDDLLSMSDEAKLGNAKTMTETNKNNFSAGGGLVYTDDEIRTSAGFDELGFDIPSEDLNEEDFEE